MSNLKPKPMKTMMMMISLACLLMIGCVTKQPKCSALAGVKEFCDSITPSRVYLKPNDVKTLIAQEAFGKVDYVPYRVKIEISDTVKYIVTFQRVKQFNY